MHWIIQDNLYREEGFGSLLETIERFEIPHTIVKVVPFSEDAPESEQTVPAVNPNGPVMVCGSTTLAKIATWRGWTSGSFLNENHDYRMWKQHYGDHLLNSQARVCRFADVEMLWSPFFIRPCEDTKSFAGGLYDAESFAEWRDKVVVLGEQTYTSLTAETMVTYSPVQQIFKEYRFFVVDGQIVGQSTYKVGKRVIYDPAVDPTAIEFAHQMIALWQPARAFVIDIAMVPDGMRIVEINCINSAGFYAIDVPKFVAAIEAMEF